jgi:hypothetical protein
LYSAYFPAVGRSPDYTATGRSDFDRLLWQVSDHPTTFVESLNKLNNLGLVALRNEAIDPTDSDASIAPQKAERITAEVLASTISSQLTERRGQHL